MSLELHQEQRVEQRLEITLRQKIEIRLAAEIIKPDAKCEECGRELDEDEVRAGWRDDAPLDFTTECPDCGHRFISELNVTSRQDGAQLGSFHYLCEEQLMYAMHQVALNRNGRIGIGFLDKNRQDILYNIVRHFGTYLRGRAIYKRWLAAR